MAMAPQEQRPAPHRRKRASARKEASGSGPRSGETGHAYVYLIYGIHQMLNCVCGPGSDANAVLIRAAEPVPDSLLWLHASARGPGNLCKAFGVKPAHNRADLCEPDGELIVLPRRGRPRIARGPRIGVDYAGPWAGEPLRFCDASSAHLSRP